MIAALAEKPVDLAYVRSLTNPERKLRAVSELIQRDDADIARRGRRRNAAAVLLYSASLGTDRPIAPKAMWRDTLMVSRSLWHKILDEANPERIRELTAEAIRLQEQINGLTADTSSEIPELVRELSKIRHRLQRHVLQVGAIEELRGELAADPSLDLLAIARTEAAAVRQAEQEVEEAKPIRDEVAAALMNRHGMANAEVARITGLSTARVAQLRVAR